MQYKLGWAIGCFVLGATSTAMLQASLVEEILASDAGFVTEEGGSSKGDAIFAPGAKYNYSVGLEVHYPEGSYSSPLAVMERRNYFVFDLSSITVPIVAAKIEIFAGVLESVNAEELFALRPIDDQAGGLGDADALLGGAIVGDFDEPTDPLIGMAKALFGKIPATPPGPPPAPPILGGGPITPAMNSTIIAFDFTPEGIDFLNFRPLDRVIFGGHVASLLDLGSPQQPFGFTGPDISGTIPPLLGSTPTPKLILTLVPEPATGLMVLLATPLAMLRRRSV